MLSGFESVILFLVTGVLFCLVGFFVNRLLTKPQPNPIKLQSYECGEEPVGNSRLQFNSRFYVIALIFLVFEVELVFLFPWATVFADRTLIAVEPAWGWMSLLEVLLFLLILIVGLIYVWKKGDLDWIKPDPIVPTFASAVPTERYQMINDQQFKVKPFEQEKQAEDSIPAAPVTTAPRPVFKPKILSKPKDGTTEA